MKEKCPVCHEGTLKTGPTTVVTHREGRTIVIKDVPGRTCDTCCERFFNEEVSNKLLKLMNEAFENDEKRQEMSYKAA